MKRVAGGLPRSNCVSCVTLSPAAQNGASRVAQGSRRTVGRSGALHLDFPRAKLRALRNAYGQHAVLETCLDPSGLELTAQRETATVEARAYVGIERLRVLG